MTIQSHLYPPLESKIVVIIHKQCLCYPEHIILIKVGACRVMMRKMMDVGGSDDEELVPSIKVS
jgi:hypothetical protein